MLSVYTQIICVVFIGSLAAKAQQESAGTDKYNYRVIIEIPVYRCDILGHVSDTTPIQVADPGAIFTVIGKTEGDSIIIRFWKWKDNKPMNESLCFADSLMIQRKYFTTASCLLRNAMPRYDNKVSFTAGNILVPVKMRLNKFDFSKDFTLGPVAGIKLRLSHYTRNCINFLAGLGVTSITLNSESTDARIEEDTDVPALSPYLGAVFDFVSQTQAGLFFGWDFISNNDKLNFVYNGKLWISFGLGFSILTKGSPSINSLEEENNGE